MASNRMTAKRVKGHGKQRTATVTQLKKKPIPLESKDCADLDKLDSEVKLLSVHKQNAELLIENTQMKLAHITSRLNTIQAKANKIVSPYLKDIPEGHYNINTKKGVIEVSPKTVVRKNSKT